MRKRTGILIGVFLLIFICKVTPAYSQYNHLYNYYLQEGIAALKGGDLHKALFYFDTANGIRPENDDVRKYLNTIKRMREDHVRDVEDESPPKKIKKKYPEVEIVSFKKKGQGKIELGKKDFKKEKKPPIKKIIKKETTPPKYVEAKKIVLNDELWSLQPNTAIDIPIKRSVIFEGKNIRQFLLIATNYGSVKRIDVNHLEVTMFVRDATLFHVWDDKGRWTFNVRGIIPVKMRDHGKPTFLEIGEEYVEPFKFGYSNNWGGSYQGDNLRDMKENNVTFTQWMGISGDTPYGQMYGSINYYKFEQTTERVGERVGLVNAKIGPFEDFSIRGLDTEKTFSDLSLPGRSFRGVLLDAYAFNKNISYSVLQGQDRAQFLFISPGSFDEKNSYIEGAQMTLFPEGDHQLSFNYARGYGEIRTENLKDKVYSVVSRNQWDKFKLNAELGYDEDALGKLGNAVYSGTNYELSASFRDIDKDYFTITGSPAGQGEVGGILDFDWYGDTVRFNANADIYRDRQLPNPDNPDTVNFQGRTRVSFPIGEKNSWSTSLFYTDTPQLISPNKTLSINNNLSTRFQLWNGRVMTTYLGQNYQRSRFQVSSSSEYDRFILSTGLRFPLSRNLSYFANYDYGWVTDISNDTITNPHVVYTGLSYTAKLTNSITGSWRVYYRNEEESDGNFTFLSGEDSLRGSLGFTYRPNNDFEIFCDAGVRNVWSESEDNASFNDADVRLGVRSSWDLLFHWDPTAVVEGYVFKDRNGDGVKDYNETGIEGIVVKVGAKEVLTDVSGKYKAQVKAKRILVKLDLNSVSKGYILTSNVSKEIWIKNNETYLHNFGLNVQSSVYGVVFVDLNENGSFDPNEKAIVNTRIILDDKKSIYTDFDGIYSFEDVPPGEHMIRLDVNSLPMKYIPLIKIQNKINILEGTTYILNVPLRENAQ